MLELWRKRSLGRNRAWAPVEQLAGEDVTLLSKTLVGIRAPAISRLQEANSSITSAVFDVGNKVGLHLSTALQAILGEGLQPKPKTPSSIEVDIPPEMKKLPFPRGFGRFPAPAQEMVDFFAEE